MKSDPKIEIGFKNVLLSTSLHRFDAREACRFIYLMLMKHVAS